MKLNDIKIKGKLGVVLLLVGVIPASVIGLYALTEASRSLEQLAFNQLESVRSIKKSQIEKFFETHKAESGVLVDTVQAMKTSVFSKMQAIQELKKETLKTLFENINKDVAITKRRPLTIKAFDAINQAFKEGNNSVDSMEWESVTELYNERFQAVMNARGWHDLLMVNNEGDIIYTAVRESDLGMNIPDSELKDTSLGRAFSKIQALNQDVIVTADFQPYAPSNGAQTAFMIGRLGHGQGYFAIRLPIDFINTVVQRRIGLGSTMESYLVGELDGVTALRSDRVVKKGNLVGKNKSDVYIKAAMAGKEGVATKVGSTGKVEVVAYAPLDIPGLNWGIFTSGSLEEVLGGEKLVDEKDYFTNFIEKYGYYDLFLIHPHGEVFYSVTHDADYKTNMLNGKYANSGLGRLTRQVLETRQYGFVDFAPYAPSNNEPASFIAQPILNNGEVELIVAMKISLDKINSIMQERDGMGETGETYLVGSDKLMRSDSFLSQKNHTVKASFANPVTGSVDTDAVRKAVSGETGAEILTDINGKEALSAYTPLNIGGTQWALIAEINKAEAFSVVSTLQNMMAFIAVVSIIVIMIVTWWIAGSIANPLKRVVDIFRRIGEGNYDNNIVAHSKDEVGMLMSELGNLQTRLDRDMTTARNQAIESGRIKTALDVASTNVMMADVNNNIIYMNNAVQTMFTEIGSELKESIPAFDASNLMGSNIDQFHRNPGHQQDLLKGLKDTYSMLIQVGNLHLQITATPVFSEDDERLGTVVEWENRTAEIGVENEVAEIVEAASNGDFSQHIKEAGKQGFYLKLAEGINGVLKTTSTRY